MQKHVQSKQKQSGQEERRRHSRGHYAEANCADADYADADADDADAECYAYTHAPWATCISIRRGLRTPQMEPHKHTQRDTQTQEAPPRRP